MRILLTSDTYEPTINGVVTSLMNLQHGLKQLGHEVRILTLSESHTTYYREGVWYLGSLNSGTIYPGTRVLDTLARKPLKDLIGWRPEIVHSQSEFSTFILAKRIAHVVGAPLVHTYHTLYEDYTAYFSTNERIGRALGKLFSRIILAQTDSVIAPTSKIEHLLRSYGVDKPIEIIPSGIDLRKFSANSEKELLDAMKVRLGIPMENLVIVYVGRLAKEKNTAELIANFSSDRTDRTLLLVGDGPQRQQLEQQVASLGRKKQIIFAGMQNQEDIPFFYRLGNVFCSASTSETQGLSYVEALASGLPVLCRADACLDGLIQNEVNGWQYHSNEEYHQYLERAFSDATLLTKLSAQARFSSARYDRLTFAESVSTVYEQLIKARTQPYRILA